jgi:hypothetical protein
VCGYSEYSEDLEVSYATIPATVPRISTSNEGCSVRVSWSSPPDNGGSTIIAFSPEIRTSSGDFVALEDLCISGDIINSCLVSMGTLYESPFSLIGDDLIIARVRAQNSRGYSEYSSNSQEERSQSAIMEFLPVMSPPTILSKNEVLLIIEWESLEDNYSFELFREGSE